MMYMQLEKNRLGHHYIRISFREILGSAFLIFPFTSY